MSAIRPRVDDVLCTYCEALRAEEICFCMFTEADGEFVCGPCFFRRARCACQFQDQIALASREFLFPSPRLRRDSPIFQRSLQFIRRHVGNWHRDFVPPHDPVRGVSISNPTDLLRWVELYKAFLVTRGGHRLIFPDDPVGALSDVPRRPFIGCTSPIRPEERDDTRTKYKNAYHGTCFQ